MSIPEDNEQALLHELCGLVVQPVRVSQEELRRYFLDVNDDRQIIAFAIIKREFQLESLQQLSENLWHKRPLELSI